MTYNEFLRDKSTKVMKKIESEEVYLYMLDAMSELVCRGMSDKKGVQVNILMEIENELVKYERENNIKR